VCLCKQNNRAKFSLSLKRLLQLAIVFLFFLNTASFAEDYGDAFVSGSIADARTLIPILASDSASAEICGLIFNGLLKYDKNIRLTGELARNWEVLDGGLTIVFHLRRGLKWHDGEPFTARDVEFTYNKLIDPDVKTPYSGDFEKVESLEVIDDYTVKVRYREPFSPGLSSWTMWIMPEHLLKDEDLNTSGFSRHPIGTGPYKFKKWLTQEKIELESNQDYFEGRPFIDRYIFRIIPDTATIFLELQMENIDSAGLTPLQYRRQTDTEFFKTHFAKYNLTSFGYTYLGYNLKRDLFKDIRVREALDYAIDKNEIIRIVLLGLGRVCTGPYVPESWAYNENVLPRPFKPELSVRLLREAGWSDSDNDGWLDKDGKRFEFTIITNQGNERRIRTAEIIQRRLQEIGIKVKIKVVEWSVFISEYIDKRNFDAVLLGWSLGRDPDNYDIWHSSKTKEGEFNFLGYANEEVDRLLVTARRQFDLRKRQECYRRIHEIIYREQPCMFLYVPDSLQIIHKRFRGVEKAPLGIGWNFIKWWVPAAEQRYRGRSLYQR